MDRPVLTSPHPTSVEDSPVASEITAAASVTAGGLDTLRDEIAEAVHLLPTQGPITVFVHHNTLHAFEHESFEDAVKDAVHVLGCHPYMQEGVYRDLLRRGRIRLSDLDAILLEDLGDDSDALVGFMGTRFHLRRAMLAFPLRTGPVHELQWLIAETDTLQRFRPEVESAVRERMVEDTRRWVMRDFRSGESRCSPRTQLLLEQTLEQFDASTMESWEAGVWEEFTLRLLWNICRGGVQRSGPPPAVGTSPVRHRDVLLDATGEDTDLLVHELLIRYCASFLDQGLADWLLPARDQGFLAAFVEVYGRGGGPPLPWLQGLGRALRRLRETGRTALESIAESLVLLGVDDSERLRYLRESLLALRGWAGMIWQMETNAEWTPHPAPEGSLIEYLAVRLILDRLAIAHVARERLGYSGPLPGVREAASTCVRRSVQDLTDQRAYQVFQVAQVRGWKPEELDCLRDEQWKQLLQEMEAFSSLERRRVYHLAYERKYCNETLDAITLHMRRLRDCGAAHDAGDPPAYQLVCCIDDREESFRRHLEECDPACETFGIAGFFGVAMYYRGSADAHFTPLCPVNIKPQHFVSEESVYSFELTDRRRAEARRRIGRATHQAHVGTRTILGGLLTGLFGSLAAFPLVARILFPRTTAQIRRHFGRIVRPPVTQLRLERLADEPGPEPDAQGYSLDEMATIVEGSLRAMGMPRQFARLVVICGHGSSSLNNPHEAAYDCGACGGGRGGPNARAFAQMANDLRVRRLLEERGLVIPEDVVFIGGYHNTCDDSMSWYDVDRLPVSHRALFERAREAIDEARRRSAHERCRRFESAELSLSIDDALRHVEGRAEDLSQTRPECGHATNALCFVGRRAWSRGLFLDRRAFLTSYDPDQDDERSSILERMLQAVIPVCAGINLEYYFSYVDPAGYGCSTKLPHNIASLLGVMDGAASDLRPGLPWQMVEIHEPVRLLFVIETTAAAMERIIEDNPAIARLVRGAWVQLAVLDGRTGQIQVYRRGRFEPYVPQSTALPEVDASLDWYRGWRGHLGFASIRETEGGR